MRAFVSTPVVLSLLLAACTAPSAGEADGVLESRIEQAQTHGGEAITRLYQDALRKNGRIDTPDAKKLTAFLKGAAQEDARKALQSVVDDVNAPLTPAARDMITSALAGKIDGDVPLDNSVYKVVLGASPTFVSDDELYIKGPGTLASQTGITGHSRGYAKKADGVLLNAHGSPMPSDAAVPGSAAEPPGLALDNAAAVYGLSLPFGFQAIAKNDYDPRAQYWEGICQAWTYSSLDERINVLVDTDGRVGQRGIWIFGHWISRADLGNFMMGVSNSLSIADAVLEDVFVKPPSLLKGIAENVMTGRRGLRADIFNDEENGRHEVWNQPITAAKLTVQDVAPAVRDAILTFAKTDAFGTSNATDVKLAQVVADYGAEVGDGYEGPVFLEQRDWNVYLVTEADGRVVTGYMAHHLARKVSGLPVTFSHALPDYFAYPKHELIDAAFAGQKSTLLDNAQEGPAFRFFVGTVLGRGIPQETRAAFEAEALAGNPNVARLQERYPGIANAYSPEQWKTVFEPILGAGTAFGAAWGTASADFPPGILAH